MQVVSKLPRVTKAADGRVTHAGFDVPFGPHGHPATKVYQFRPTDPLKEGEQVCEVTDEEHLAVFASIPEGYEIRPTPDEPILPTDDKVAADAKKKKNAEKHAAEKAVLSKAGAKGDALAKKRVSDARLAQQKLDQAAVNRQKRAKANKGKGKEGADPDNNFEVANLDKD